MNGLAVAQNNLENDEKLSGLMKINSYGHKKLYS